MFLFLVSCLKLSKFPSVNKPCFHFCEETQGFQWLSFSYPTCVSLVTKIYHSKAYINYVLTIEDEKVTRDHGGWRRQNMYRFTSLPGWMRFGYSLGGVDRSSMELPPATQYSMQTRQAYQPYLAQTQTLVPVHRNCANFANRFCTLYRVRVDPDEPACRSFTPRNLNPPQIPSVRRGFPVAKIPQIPKEQEIQMLKDRARMLEQQLQQTKKRLEELKEKVVK